jgi:tetratricopeptide (TPR) repeat protein
MKLPDSLRFWRRDLGSREDMREPWRLISLGQFQAAEDACRALLRRNRSHLEALHCLGALHQRAGRHEEAVPLFEKVIRLAPGNVSAHGNLVDSLAALDRLEEAEDVADKALKLIPDSAAASRSLAGACHRLGRYADAVACGRRAVALEPTAVENHLGLGISLRALGRSAEALACYDEAVRLRPNDPVILASRGNVLGDMGRFDDAVASYRQSIRLRPDYAPTWQMLCSVRRFKRYDGEVKAMEELYEASTTPAEHRMSLAFALGKVFEDLHDYERAFGYFAEGNRIRRTLAPYSIDTDAALIARLKAAFDASFFASRRDVGRPDPRPIFVLGMPRSGTTLIEQILASHPLVHGAGELVDLEAVCKRVMNGLPESVRTLSAADWQRMADRYLTRLRGRDASKPFVTDKMPDNFLRIGMIATMLPQARIVHCVRDPLDTCVSCYRNVFAASGLRWSYDLADVGRYYRLYAELMDHWRTVLPGRIIDVRYEELVADPEAAIRRLLAACGLEFDPACLAFHRAERAVLTRSLAQVRRPVYRDSLQAWKRYGRHIGPLIEALGTAGADAR